MSNGFNFGIKDWVWVNISNHLITFGFKGVPDDVHFTLSFNEKSPDINFHITRNTDDERNKPKIEILRVNKWLLENLAKENVNAILLAFLDPIDPTQFTSSDFYFVPFEAMTEGDSGKLSEQMVIDTFKDLTLLTKNGKKVRINGDVEGKALEMATSQSFVDHIFNHVVEFPPKNDKATSGGMMFMLDKYEALFCIQEKWYRMRKDFQVPELLKILIAPRSVESLKYYFFRSLKRVQAASSISDTEKFNFPHIVKRIENLNLQKDVRWELVDSGKTFETFKLSLPKLFLKPEVPDEVREHIRIASKILEHSYFVYEFIDVALTQVIIGLEKALKHRYLQITGKDGENESFYNLIEWGFENELFELENKDFLHSYRVVRNGKVHSSKNSLGGFVYLKKLIEPVLCINDLYEDSLLRRQRKLEGKILADTIRSILANGAVLESNNMFNVVVDVFVVFVNNKKTKSETHIAIALAFDLTPIAQGHHLNPRVDYWQLNDYTLESDRLSFTSNEGATYVLRPPVGAELALVKFWKNGLESLGMDGRVVLAAIPYQVGEHFVEVLQDFHRN